MAQVPETGDRVITGYEPVLMHLKQAQTLAGQLGDKAIVALIETLEHLCLTRARVNSERMMQTEPLVSSQAPVASLSVYLFGTFQALLNGTPVNGWRKKSEALFKYLIVHRITPVHREKLLELFWPDLDPQPARNCLNVTLHALRQSLQINGATNITNSLIQFANDHYSLRPDINVWTDTGTFMDYITISQSALKRGDKADALAHYEMAATLYRGHFLQDDYYEEWTIRYREHLQSAFMALLADLSQLYFIDGNYAAALERSLKILEYDNCNEDAHCQIMRCYYALGRRGLALRQYHVFCDILTRILGVRPMDETIRLYEQIHKGSLG